MCKKLSLFFIGLFILVTAFPIWGNDWGYVHLLGFPVLAYPLQWFWIGMIIATFGFNYCIGGGERRPVGLVLCSWWAANYTVIYYLHYLTERGVEQAGSDVNLEIFGSIYSFPALMFDFIPLASVDLAALMVILALIKFRVLVASGWLIIFMLFLAANLWGHAMGANDLRMGVDEVIAAQKYDAYLYLTFTAVVILLTIGSGWSAYLRWKNSTFDLYCDIRPMLTGAYHRFIHLP